LSSTACSHFLKLPFHSTKSFPSQRTVLLASIFCSSFLLPDSSFHGFTFVLASFRNGLIERTWPPTPTLPPPIAASRPSTGSVSRYWPVRSASRATGSLSGSAPATSTFRRFRFSRCVLYVGHLFPSPTVFQDNKVHRIQNNFQIGMCLLHKRVGSFWLRNFHERTVGVCIRLGC